MPILKTAHKKPKPDLQDVKKTDPFYTTAPWRRFVRRNGKRVDVGIRAQKLRKNPLCEISLKQGKMVKATFVDHHKTRKIFPELELDMDNLVSMCKRYHDQKRALEKGLKTKEDWHRVFDNHKVFKI